MTIAFTDLDIPYSVRENAPCAELFQEFLRAKLILFGGSPLNLSKLEVSSEDAMWCVA
jgi:hypothetical protein